MFSAQTRTRRSSDTLDRLERAEPLSDHERPRIEGRLNFDFHTVRDVPVELGLRRVAVGRVAHLDRRHDRRDADQHVFATKGLAFVIIREDALDDAFSLTSRDRF